MLSLQGLPIPSSIRFFFVFKKLFLNPFRLLAHAGFDARDAVKFWEQRSGPAAECGRSCQPEAPSETFKIARQIMGASHPVSELRVTRLKDELARWEIERQRVIDSISSSTNPS